MEKSEINKIITDFIDSIDSLLEISTPIMVMTGKMHREFSEQHIAQLEKYGRLVKDEGNTKKYSVNINNIKGLERTRKKIEKVTKSRELLPKTILISFVIIFDSLLRNLIKELYGLKPELIKQSKRTLTFNEIANIGDVGDIRRHIIDEEIDDLLRGSHYDLIESLEKIFSVQLKPEEKLWQKFIELTERRNIFVHCNGIVSSQYIKICSKHNSLPDGISIGDQLTADRKYIYDCYCCIYEIGIMVTHILWRKFAKNELEDSDLSLNTIGYNMLVDKNYDMATKIFIFAKNIPKHSSDSLRRTHVVNLSIAYKLSGKISEFDATINKEDWSSCSDDFKLCVNALTGKHNEAVNLMKKLGKSSDIVPERAYIEWPAFEEFRKTTEFIGAFKEIFGHAPEKSGDYEIIPL
jgi:hypothetical protein